MGSTQRDAALAVNALGVDLYRGLAGGASSFVLSPLSIQLALAMTFAGAAGETRDEMLRVLHFGHAEDIHRAFEDLRAALAGAAGEGGAIDVANRLFVKRDAGLRASFVELALARYAAAPEEVDFGQAEAARTHINAWVARATREKIRDLVPRGLLDAETRLVLVNALYLRAAWAEQFNAAMTRDEPFHAGGGSAVPVATMARKMACGFEETKSRVVLTLPFDSHALTLVIVMPKARDGLAEVERALDTELLSFTPHLPAIEAIVHLPRLRLEPDAIALSDALAELGLETAFDRPKGSANFDAMAPRRPDAYLFIQEVLHKTFFAIDEQGVEAAAATAVMMPLGAGIPRERPREIRVDRPFLFAVQHASGACLFLGRVMDPRPPGGA